MVSSYDNLKAWILQLPEVKESPHRFGGTEFQVAGVEFMHSHGSSILDIRLSASDQARVLEAGEAQRHQFAPQAGWVSFRIKGPDDLDRAKRVIQMAYENAKKKLEDVKSRRSNSKLGEY